MATLLSNELKALVVLGNINEVPKSVLKESCLTVQSFDYECARKSTKSGDVDGAMNPVILSFSVRINDPEDAQKFFSEFSRNDISTFSFLFNATYDVFQRLSDYDNNMVCEGYVVGAEEVYQNSSSEADQYLQLLLNVKLLVSTITYSGQEDHQKLQGVFINKK